MIRTMELRETDRMKAEFMTEETHTFVDVFFNMDDAYYWLDSLKQDYPENEWEIIEERVNLLGGGYRAGISFMKRQKELFDL